MTTHFQASIDKRTGMRAVALVCLWAGEVVQGSN